MKINKSLIPLKLHYFLIYGAQAGYYAFLPIIAENLHFSPTSFAVIYTTMPFFDMVAGPVLGAVGDRLKCWRGLIAFLLFLVSIMGFFLYYIPDFTPSLLVPEFDGQITCVDNSTLLELQGYFNSSCLLKKLENKTLMCDATCGPCYPYPSWVNDSETLEEVQQCKDIDTHFRVRLNTPFQFDGRLDVSELRRYGSRDLLPCSTKMCQMSCSESLRKCFHSIKETSIDIYATSRFWTFFLAVFFNWVPAVAVYLLTNATCFEMLGKNPERFGQQRLWGSLGMGLMAIACGYLVGATSPVKDEPDYLSIVVIQAVFFGADMLLLRYLNIVQPPSTTYFSQAIIPFLFKPSFLLFYAGTVLAAAFQGLQWTYQFWFLETLGAPPMLVGLLQAVETFLGEIPFLFFSGKLLSKLGYYLCLVLGFLAFGIRFVFYSYLHSPWYILPFGIFQGPALALLRVVIAAYAKEVAPKGLEATMQGFINSGFELGVATGILTGGVIYETYGPRFTWRLYGLTSFGFAIFYACIHCLLPNGVTPAARGGDLPAQGALYTPLKRTSFIRKK